MCRRTMERCGRPEMRAAATKSLSRRVSAWPRAMRAWMAHWTAIRASSAEVRPAGIGPKLVSDPITTTRASNRISRGNEMTASTTRIRVESSQRRRVAPENVPIVVPTTRAKPAATTAATRSMRPPANVRTNTSRPTASVPKGWANEGGWNAAATKSPGSWDARMGTKMHIRTTVVRSTRPTAMLARLPKYRRTTPSRNSRPGLVGAEAVRALMLASPAGRRGVDHLGQQVADDHRHRGDEGDSLDHRVVAARDGLDHLGAQARQPEHGFDD